MMLRTNACLGLLASLILLRAVALSAQEPQKSNDPQRACDSATNQLELNQCADEQYHKADVRLNAIYRKALGIMQKNLADAQQQKDTQLIKYSQQAIEKLKTAEKAWIQYRDLHCDAARHQNQGGSISPMIWGFCMAETTLDRIKEIKSAYEAGDVKLEQ